MQTESMEASPWSTPTRNATCTRWDSLRSTTRFFFFQAEDGIRDYKVTGVQTCALPILGFSVGHPAITAGSIGARVTDGVNVYILSNNHVLANSNDASIGDPELQPGA